MNKSAEQVAKEIIELTPTLWVEAHKIKNEAGLPIEFKDHYFMMDFYNDMSPLQVMLKAPQIGATVAEIIKSFHCARYKKWDIIYTLPTQGDVSDMAGGKINRIVAQNPVLGDWVKEHDTVEQKSIGDSIIYYRGTYSNKQAMMVSSDLNIHDEVDASDAEVIQQYETRLQAKADGRRWYFSHPSLAGFGVDIPWQQSDKKEWFIKCNNCSEEQQLKWPENVDLVSKKYICGLCKQQLSTEARRSGRWAPTSKGLFSGYHVSQLMCPWISAEKIVYDW
jgi:phage terminase large subunit GpA-like protein